MLLTACGLNHKTAPIAVRERLAFVPEQLPHSLQQLLQYTGTQEATILSTCNRTEIYSATQEPEKLLQWLAASHNIPANEISPHLYYHHGKEAIKHMLRVASGLDSMVLGEPQILGQMKTAFQTAISAGATGPQLQRIFQYIFSATKSIRSQTGIGNQAVSIAFAAINLTKHIFSDLKQTTALLIGAGNTVELCLRYLTKLELKELWLANRTFAKAEQLATKFSAVPLELSQLPNMVANADIIISATAAPLPIIGKGLIERALKTRKHKPMLLLDLGVPRNIEPEISAMADAYLYSIDDLQKIINNNLQDRSLAAKQAEELIELQAEQYMRWLHSLDSVATIRGFREKIEQTRDQEVTKALNLLAHGHAPEIVLQAFANNLTNKIMHTPTINLRTAGANEQKELLACTRILFALDEE